ncbi:hypothetical protein RAR94_15275 [Vibrio vulnificus]
MKVRRLDKSLLGVDVSILRRIKYSQPQRRFLFEGSLQAYPSTFLLGSDFSMSNAVQAIGFRLADGTDAVGIVNRFDKTLGSLSNPKFFALAPSQQLDVNLDDSVTLSSPLEVAYTTAGDNLTYSFYIKPATAGLLRVQYWLGDSSLGAPIVDFEVPITQEQVDLDQPVLVEPNFYVLSGNSDLFVRFSGVNLKGSATLPYFSSAILPYKEVQINGHVEYITANLSPLFIGCSYAVNTSQSASGVTLTVGDRFRDSFEVFDAGGTFSVGKPCYVDFTAFGQGIKALSTSKDYYKFYYDGAQWRFLDVSTKDGGVV